MNQYYVYILRCCDNTFYVGITNNVSKRLEEHNSSRGAKYTKGRTPVTLYYLEESSSRSDALKREHALRKLTHKQKEKLGR